MNGIHAALLKARTMPLKASKDDDQTSCQNALSMKNSNSTARIIEGHRCWVHKVLSKLIGKGRNCF